MATFVDRVVLQVTAGNGGHGVASVKRGEVRRSGPRRRQRWPRRVGRPCRRPQTTTLIDYHHAPHRKADNGRPGAGDERNGGNGEDLVLKVPEGTVVQRRAREDPRRPRRGGMA